MTTAEILPRLGKRRVVDVHQGDVQALHRAITARGAPVRANRVLAVVSKMFALALVTREGEAEPWRLPTLGNPCAGVDRNPEQGRERIFSEAENESIADRSEEHTSDVPSQMRIQYAVLCLKKKKT